jgi:hypothetical protein
MYANYNEYSAIIGIIRVHSRNSRFNSGLIGVSLGRWNKGEAHNDDAAFAFAARAVPAALSA